MDEIEHLRAEIARLRTAGDRLWWLLAEASSARDWPDSVRERWSEALAAWGPTQEELRG